MSKTCAGAIARFLIANPSAESLTLVKWSVPKQSRRFVVCAVFLFALGFQGCGGGPGGSITPPPPPPPPTPTFTTIDAAGAGTQGFQGTYPVQVNESGEITGTVIDAQTSEHGFIRDTAGVVTVFDEPNAIPAPNFGTIVSGLNNSGEVVGGFQYLDPNTHLEISSGYVRTSDGTFTEVPGTLNTLTTVSCLNDAGQFGGFEISPTSVAAFIGELGQQLVMFSPPNVGAGAQTFTQGCKLNASGVMAGDATDSNSVVHAFLRTTDGTLTAIDVNGAGTTPLAGTYAYGINASGEVVGTVAAAGVSHAFTRAADGTITTFDPPGAGAAGSQGVGINDSGEIVGRYVDANGVTHGFLRDSSGTYTVLDDPNASQTPNSQGTQAFYINNAGTIIGVYYDAAGTEHGFVRK
jgi:hypothetical protein